MAERLLLAIKFQPSQYAPGPKLYAIACCCVVGYSALARQLSDQVTILFHILVAPPIMVSTRRSSRACQEESASGADPGSSSQQQEPTLAAQRPSRRKKVSGSSTSVLSTLASQEALDKGVTSKETVAACEHGPSQQVPLVTVEEDALESTQENIQEPQNNLASDPIAVSHSNRGSAQPQTQASQITQPNRPTQHQVLDPWADVSDSDSDDEDEGSHQAGGIQDLMSSLAASIRAAFQSKSGQHSNRQVQQQQQLHNEQQAAQVQQEDNEKQVEGSDIQGAQLHWQPRIAIPQQKAPSREVLKVDIKAEKDKTLAKKLLVPSDNKSKKGPRPDQADKKWYELPVQKIDVDMKRELRLLRLRGAYDPKRFYKSFDNTKFPTRFAMGTVIAAPGEQLTGTLGRAQRRKATLTEQLLADVEITQARKKRFRKLQDDATKYQKVKKRKTDLPRLQKSKHRPKH